MATEEKRLDAPAIYAGFESMGSYLRERGAHAELAVYGGTAILLQFDWRTITQDVDALALRGTREDLVRDAATYAGLLHDLPDEWLNNGVGGFTPLTEKPDFFTPLASFPEDGAPGLRVYLAKPQYLCAMKLKALQRADPQDKDFTDAVRLAQAAGIHDERELTRMFTAFFPDEDMPPIAVARLAEVACQAGACSEATGTPA